jgi:SAM-dependent methyltransferase
MTTLNPYDELPYKSRSIEWTAPERLALASLLHGGPRQPLDTYRVLELGCGDGANLLPLAYYRRHATFLGVDGARCQIDVANSGKSALELSNIEFIHADFLTADHRLAGDFDYIIAHGIFSWVPHDVRDALLQLCAKRLRRGGLLYLNYNTNPGWNVRGMVREFLLAQTAGTTSLLIRAQQAQEVATKVVSSLTVGEHPYSQLIAKEFQFVCENHVSYVAHEYLAADNHPYWRSEFMALAGHHDLEYVADADFNYSSGRIPEDVAPRLVELQITGRALDDTVDLLCYRQLHTPILTHSPLMRRRPSTEEFANLLVASCLTPCAPSSAENPMFQHPSGYQVEAKEEVIRTALEKLQPLWPRGLRIGAVFPDVRHVMDDLKLLHRNGLIELRCIEPAEFGVCPEPLNRLEGRRGGYATSPYHTREDIPTEFEANTFIRTRAQLDNTGVPGAERVIFSSHLLWPAMGKHNNVGIDEPYTI